MRQVHNSYIRQLIVDEAATSVPYTIVVRTM